MSTVCTAESQAQSSALGGSQSSLPTSVKPAGGSGVASFKAAATASLLLRPAFFCFLASALGVEEPVDWRPRFLETFCSATGLPPILAQ